MFAMKTTRKRMFFFKLCFVTAKHRSIYFSCRHCTYPMMLSSVLLHVVEAFEKWHVKVFYHCCLYVSPILFFSHSHRRVIHQYSFISIYAVCLGIIVYLFWLNEGRKNNHPFANRVNEDIIFKACKTKIDIWKYNLRAFLRSCIESFAFPIFKMNMNNPHLLKFDWNQYT
jgi:hypothetical protein